MTRVPRAAAAAAALAALAAAGCGKAAPSSDTTAAAPTPTSELTATTPAPSADAGKLTWAVYREVETLDPIQAFDYPDNTAITALCESLLQQQPDGSIKPGLATLTHPDPTTTVITLKDGPKFWDGKPVTTDDVVFSLKRAASTTSGSFYPAVFSRVSSIAATGPKQVTIKLKQPDYWLDGELSQMAGVVVEKAYAESKGRAFGTPQGGTMCTGAFKLGHWTAGGDLDIVRNDAYWNPAGKAHAAGITFKGVPDEASLTTALLTGGVDGTYPQALSALDRLRASDKLTVTEGPSWAMDALVISNLKGPLGDVKVRQALSLALDRKAYIQQVYHGAAQLPRTLANPGTWGYGKDVFQADWDKLPDPTQNLAKAKQLIQEAGAKGETITVGMSSQVSNLLAEGNAVRSAGQAIGLNVKLKSVSAADFINFFTDPKAREGVDAFPTVNYGDYADPAAFYNTFVAPDGSQNYDGFHDAQITDDLDAARTTADPTERARLVAKAGDRIMQLLPWIPMAAPSEMLITSSKLTGAPASFVYMGGPWANMIGEK